MALAATVVYQCAAPRLIERALHDRFAAAGYEDARFEVTAATLGRLELADVTLRDGLALGDVEVDAGPWALWRGDPADVVLHQPRLDARALSALTSPRPGSATSAARAFRKIRIEDGELAVDDTTIAITGTLDLARSTVDVTARAPRLAIAGVEARDVAARIHGTPAALRACVAGTIAGTEAEACTTASARALRDLRALDVAWQARDPDAGWTAHGRGRVVREAGAIAIERGHVELEVAVDDDRVAVSAALAGPLDALAATGTLRAAHLAVGTASLRDVTLPFEVRGRVVDTPAPRPPASAAARAAAAIATTAHEPRHRLELITDAPLVATTRGGTVRLSGSDLVFGGARLTARGRLALAGGAIELRAAPGRGARALAFDLDVEGVRLDPFLAKASEGQIRGTGLLDGRLAFELADTGWAIRGGALRARRGGRLEVAAAAAQSGGVVEERILGALADFAYRRLTLAVGRDPQLRLELAGRGRRVPQELTIVLNVRGITQRLAGTL